MPPSLQTLLPWTKSPLVANAPMGGFATAPLATAVSLSGGLGQIGANLGRTSQGLIPVSIGFLLFIVELENVLPVVEKHKPAAVWLFAAKELGDYKTWSEGIRRVLPGTLVFIQLGSVAVALEVAQTCAPDAICVQGSDAGGHGFEKGAGIISLLPEVADALAEAGFEIPLLAAGGLADARSAAAAFALGAEGVVLGTRFLAATETSIHPGYRAANLAAKDGGQTTVRTKVFDELKGPNIWPEAYDGRGIVTKSWTDHGKGVQMDEIRRLYAQAVKEDAAGYGLDGKGRATMWAGSGVGLVNKQQDAAEIVDEVRRGISQVLHRTQARL